MSPVPARVLPFPMQVQPTCTHILEILALWQLFNKKQATAASKECGKQKFLGVVLVSVLLKGDMFLHSSEVSRGSELRLVLSPKPVWPHTPQHR